ncbi:hypothetical protein [Rahnella aceris]
MLLSAPLMLVIIGLGSFAVRENHSLTILKEGNIPPVPCTLITLVNGES